MDVSGESVSETFDLSVTRVNSAPTTAGIADITRNENSADEAVDLFAVFDDEEDADNSLSYAVVTNTNTALFSSLAINPSSGMLEIHYAANHSGSSIITVRATDVDGSSVETSFTVTVIHINTAPVGLAMNDISATTEMPPAQIDLRNFFNDAEDGVALQYSVVGNSNPVLAQLAALDSSNGLLTLNFNTGVLGETTITIRATDTQGAWVDSSFNVSVSAPVNSNPPIENPQPPIDITPTPPIEAPQEPVVQQPSPDIPPPGEGNPVVTPPITNSLEGPVVAADNSTTILANNMGEVPALITPAEFANSFDNDDRNRPEWTNHEKEFAEQERQAANPYATLASLITPESAYLNAQEITDFNQEVSRVRADMAKVLEEEQQQHAVVAGVTLSITTGLLIWSLRASSLLLTLFSMLPLWKGIDPLPILDEVNKRKKKLEQQRKDKAKEDRNAAEVGYLFDHNHKDSH